MNSKIDTITAFEAFIKNFTPCYTSDEYNYELCRKALEVMKEQAVIIKEQDEKIKRIKTSIITLCRDLIV